MTRVAIIATVVLALLGAGAASAGAQSSGSPGRVEIAIGAVWMGHTPLTTGDANETTPTGGAFRLFTTSTTLGAMTGAEVHVGLHIGRRLEVFGAGTYGKRQLRIAATDDTENAAPVTATERLEQFTFTGGALWFLSRSRLAPFISAEAGNLRELHAEQTLVESGRVYMLGGGVTILFSTLRGGDLGIGARIDARAALRSKAFLLDTARITPTLGLSMFVWF